MDRTAYQRHYTIDQRHFWREAKRALVLEWVQKYYDKSGSSSLRLCDIGGACSLVTKELERFGTVCCVEPDHETALLARAMLHVDVLEGALPQPLPVDIGTFDCITMLDVLEHIEDEQSALESVYSLLNAGGVFVCTVPALPALWGPHDIVLHHKRRYMRNEFCERLTMAGFAVKKLSYYTSLLLPILFAQRRLQRRRRGSEDMVYDVKIPWQPVNMALKFVMNCERSLLRFVDMPIGSALFAVCEK